MDVLIIGSGYVGGNLVSFFERNGISAVGTHYRSEQPETRFFDIEKSRINETFLNRKFSHAVFSAASYKRVDDFKRNEKRCLAIDIAGTKRVIDECFARGVFPVYLSTDYVFDGEKGNYSEDDKTNSINFYGAIKVEIENHLGSSGRPFAVVRNGRVFGVEKNDGTLISEMRKQLSQSGERKFANDQIFTPIFIEDLCDAVKKIVLENYSGVLHVASLNPISHYEIARTINEHFDLGKKIEEASIDTFCTVEKRPKRIDLNTEKYESISGFRKKDLRKFLKKLD